MLYHSTNKISSPVNFREATILGQAPDLGLFFPEKIPFISKKNLDRLIIKENAQIAFEIIRPYIGGTIPDDELFTICAKTVNFDFPLVKITDKIYSLELFHGPTLAFKDVGARFMSLCLGYFSRGEKKNITVLVATSGDTGSAVANGFLGVEGVNVVILYPSGKVSRIQELQLTSLGKNISALEVQGNFDDCQRMVKLAFADEKIRQNIFLTSANSINVARWLPQQFYYYFALKQWPYKPDPVISVPSGNFGNICAGLLAKSSGLGIKHFIAACNSNNVFTDYISTGKFNPKNTISTISNAMDVGNPSNFVRILELFRKDYKRLKKMVSSHSISEEETGNTLSDIFKNYNYILDPHGAVGYASLEQYLNGNSDEKGIFLETAHPVKFKEVVESIIKHPVEIPSRVKKISSAKKRSLLIKPDFEELKEFLL